MSYRCIYCGRFSFGSFYMTLLPNIFGNCTGTQRSGGSTYGNQIQARLQWHQEAIRELEQERLRYCEAYQIDSMPIKRGLENVAISLEDAVKQFSTQINDRNTRLRNLQTTHSIMWGAAFEVFSGAATLYAGVRSHPNQLPSSEAAANSTNVAGASVILHGALVAAIFTPNLDLKNHCGFRTIQRILASPHFPYSSLVSSLDRLGKRKLSEDLNRLFEQYENRLLGHDYIEGMFQECLFNSIDILVDCVNNQIDRLSNRIFLLSDSGTILDSITLEDGTRISPRNIIDNSRSVNDLMATREQIFANEDSLIANIRSYIPGNRGIFFLSKKELTLHMKALVLAAAVNAYDKSEVAYSK